MGNNPSEGRQQADRVSATGERLCESGQNSANAGEERVHLRAYTGICIFARVRAGPLLQIRTTTWPPLLLLAAIFIAVTPAAQAQPRFDVVSVKPNRSADRNVRWIFESGRFTAVNVTLKMLVSTAYGPAQQPLPDFQIIGGPDWFATARFDITGVTDTSAALPPLIRQLVEERFAVRARFESRDLPVYALVLARADGTLGPRMRRNDRDCATLARGVSDERCGGEIFPGKVFARGITPTQMVSALARLMPNVGRPVIDRTGLEGTYDLDLSWTPDQLLPNQPPDTPVQAFDPNAPSLFTALEEQLGLKLDPQRDAVNVLVIEGAQPPSAD